MKRPITDQQKTFSQGYEPGSMASTFDNETRKRYNDWIKRKTADNHAFERQMERAYLYEDV